MDLAVGTLLYKAGVEWSILYIPTSFEKDFGKYIISNIRPDGREFIDVVTSQQIEQEFTFSK